MQRKLEFYERHGTLEYYLYDPDDFYLSGWIRESEHLRLIDPIDGFISPRLGIQFLSDGSAPWRLRLPDGSFLPRYEEWIQAQQRAERLAQKLRDLGVGSCD